MSSKFMSKCNFNDNQVNFNYLSVYKLTKRHKKCHNVLISTFGINFDVKINYCSLQLKQINQTNF